jgi:hypothetical protein
MRPGRINEITNPNFTENSDGWFFENELSTDIVTDSGLHPHSVLSGNALEVYPDGEGDVSIYTDITTVFPEEYYTFSVYYNTAYYGEGTST